MKYENALVIYSSSKNQILNTIDKDQLQSFLKDKFNLDVHKGNYGIYYLESKPK